MSNKKKINKIHSLSVCQTQFSAKRLNRSGRNLVGRWELEFKGGSPFKQRGNLKKLPNIEMLTGKILDERKVDSPRNRKKIKTHSMPAINTSTTDKNK